MEWLHITVAAGLAASLAIVERSFGWGRPTRSEPMNRRTFLKSRRRRPRRRCCGLVVADAALPQAKITRIRFYEAPKVMPLQIPLLQSNMVVTIETDANMTGIGEGGTRDTLEPCAGRLIGKNPFHIERLWQDMYRAFHYPPGRERLHAIGALDLALWDLKGKALGVPVYELLGGMNRNYLECYTTTFRGGGNTLRDRAAACMEAGWRLFRFDAASVRRAAAPTTRASACGRCRPTAAPRAKASARRQLHGRLPPALHVRRRAARLPPDRGVRALSGRRSGADRLVPAGHSQAAHPDQRPARRRRRMGRPLGFPSPGREPRPRLRALLAAERRRHHRNDPHLRAVRDARHRHRPAFHRPDRDGGADSRAWAVSAVGRLRIQLRRRSPSRISTSS